MELDTYLGSKSHILHSNQRSQNYFNIGFFPVPVRVRGRGRHHRPGQHLRGAEQLLVQRVQPGPGQQQRVRVYEAPPGGERRVCRRPTHNQQDQGTP